MRAQIRLGMIARMARLNVEHKPRQDEFEEVLKTIIAACGVDEEQEPARTA